MVSPDMIALMERDTPKVNPLIGNGLASSELTRVEEYVDQIFTLAAKGFPADLVYTGYKRCTPSEEFKHKAKKKDNKLVYDIARSDMYLVNFYFRYKGDELMVPLFLPFCGDAGIIHISGSRHAISPVLTDRVISVGVNDIFVALLRGKVTFQRLSHTIKCDGRNESADVVWAKAYNKTDKQSKTRATNQAEPSLAHYLFCKYGFYETFRKFTGAQVVVGNAEINENHYPAADYAIFSSIGVKPVTSRERGMYVSSTIRIAVRRDTITPMVKNLIAGFFYVVDHFPTRITPEYVDHQRLWLILLGHILLSGNENEGKLAAEMEDHVRSLDSYLDRPVANSLKDIGITVENFFELMATMMERYSEWLQEGSDKVNSMYGKKIGVIYHVLYEISSSIFKTYFQLHAISKRDVTFKEIQSIFNRHLKPGKIYSITKDHREIASSSYSGDNKLFKFTTILIPQAELQKGASMKTRTSMKDPTKKLHASVAEVGGYLFIPKAMPDGRGRINPFVDVDEKGTIKRNPNLVELLDGVQKMLTA